MPPPDGVTLSASPTWEERPRAPLWELIKGIFWGEVLGSIVATCVLVLLWLPHLTTFRGRGDELYWPWPVDGAWTLVGDLSWAIAVVALIAWAVQLNAGDRTDPRLSFMWTWIAVAAAGYTGMAVRVSGPVQALIAVLGGGVLLRVLGFKRSGAARRWPERLTHPSAAAILPLALLVALSFSLLHPFVVTGSGGGATRFKSSPNRTIEVVKAGRTVSQDIGFSLGGLPVRVTGISPLGTEPGVLASDAVAAADHDLLLSATSTLPVSVPYGHELWARFYLTLATCAKHPSTALTGLRVRYRALGLMTLTQTVELDQPIELTCARH